MINNKIYSIKELSNAVNNVLSSINIVTIEGEVVLPMIRDSRTNQVRNKELDPNEHWYFPLKDLNEPDDYQFDVTVFTYNRVADVIPKNGDVVRVTGYINRQNVSVYSKSNKLSFRGYKVEIAGTGQFYATFKKTYAKLEPLGYFDAARKKPLPPYPMRIAVISGKQTAALRDAVFQIESRWPCAETLVFPALMQGAVSPASVIRALRQADASNCDVMILTRGGGQVSELWCFNDENLAHEIARLKTPLIAGLGHKQDDTIAGLVADYNAATPTEAGIIATPKKSEVVRDINDSVDRIKTTVHNKMNISSQQIKILEMELDKIRVRGENELIGIDSLMKQLKEYLKKMPTDEALPLNYLKNQLAASGTGICRNNRIQIASLKDTLYPDIMKYYTHQLQTVSRSRELIDTLGPLKVLRRGYSVTRQNEKVIRSVDDITADDIMETRLADGYIISKPLRKEKNHG